MRITRLRFVSLVPIFLFFLACAKWDHGPLGRLRQLGLLGLFLLALIFYSVQYRAFRQKNFRPWQLTLDGVLSVIIFGGLLLLTGGVESPAAALIPAGSLFLSLHPAYPRRLSPLAPLAPLALLVGLLILPFLLHGVLTLWGNAPPPPSFFVPSPGTGERPAYVLLFLVILVLATVLMTMIGVRLKRSFEHIVQDVDRARAEQVALHLSQNREFLRASDGVAHELKNPLSSLKGLTQLLCKGAPHGSKERERLDVMLREIDRMRSILDEFRALNRPLTQLDARSISLAELFKEVILLQQGQAHAHNVQMYYQDPGSMNLLVDPQKLKAALLNLLQNSLEATAPGDSIELAAKVDPVARTLRIHVSDTGKGLTQEAKEHLFQPGYSTKPEGSGIGLLLVRQVARQHQGEFVLEARPEGGCLATITLPWQSQHHGATP